MIQKIKYQKRTKQVMEIKQWYSVSEAMAFLDMSPNTFKKIVDENNLSVSFIGSKRYYKVNELRDLFTPVQK